MYTEGGFFIGGNLAKRVSQNGFTVRTSSQVEPLSWITGRVHPDFHSTFDRLCKRYNAEVESITRAHSWGWADRAIRGSSVVSNHASGTAIDLNAPKHPLGASGTFTSKQVRAIRAILKDFPEVRWGGDYTGRKDEMHFEIRKGVRTTVSKMVSPYEGRFTSGYDLNRWITYNGKRIRSPHAGLDIAPPTPGVAGEPVYAMFAGTVRKVVSWAKAGNTSSTWAPGRTGNGVLVSNPDGEGQGYNHVRPVVKEGQKVKAGDLIGYTDRSGRQTGPHLHLETWSNWKNPNSHFNPKILFDKYSIKVGSKPKKTSSGGGTPAPPKESNNMSWSDRSLDYVNTKKKTTARHQLARIHQYTNGLRNVVRDIMMYDIKVAGATKSALGVSSINVAQALRYAAAALFEQRKVHSRVWSFRGIDYVNPKNKSTQQHKLSRAHEYAFKAPSRVWSKRYVPFIEIRNAWPSIRKDGYTMRAWVQYGYMWARRAHEQSVRNGEAIEALARAEGDAIYDAVQQALEDYDKRQVEVSIRVLDAATDDVEDPEATLAADADEVEIDEDQEV